MDYKVTKFNTNPYTHWAKFISFFSYYWEYLLLSKF